MLPAQGFQTWGNVKLRHFFKEHQHFVIVATTAIGLTGLALYLALSGHFRPIIRGEALYDISYPMLFSFWDGIVEFFRERVQARLLHGVLISVLEGFFGFAPPYFYFTAASLTVLSAALLSQILKKYIEPGWQSVLIVLTLSLLPSVSPWLSDLGKLHHALAWALFWLSCLLLQNWVKQGNPWWLIGSFVFFLASFLSYEATAFLLPVGILLSSQYMKTNKQFFYSLIVSIAMTGLVYLSSLLIYKAFGVMPQRTTTMGLFEILASPLNSIAAVFTFFSNRSLAGSLPYSRAATQTGLALVILLMGYGLTICLTKFKTRINDISEDFWLSISAFWLIFATYLPFYFVGQRFGSDPFVGMGYSTVLLLLAVAWHLRIAKNKTAGKFILGLMLIMISISGVLALQYRMDRSKGDDARFITFINSLHQQIPSVKENSTFVLVNENWGRTACLGYMNILYSRKNLSCIHLLANSQEETYVRTQAGLIENTGRLFDPDFILLQVNENGEVILLEALSPEDYPLLPIDWDSPVPLTTNLERIQSFPSRNSFIEFFESLK